MFFYRISSFCEPGSRSTPAVFYLFSLLPIQSLSSVTFFWLGYSSCRSFEASTTRKRTNGWAEWTDYDRITQTRLGFSMSADLLTSFKSFQPLLFCPYGRQHFANYFTRDPRVRCLWKCTIICYEDAQQM